MGVRDLESEYRGGRLLEAMREQDLVDHEEELASALIDVGETVVCTAGSVVYEKGEATKGIYTGRAGREFANHKPSLVLGKPRPMPRDDVECHLRQSLNKAIDTSLRLRRSCGSSST